MYQNIPIVYFMGSDTAVGRSSEIVDTYKEWKSNVDLFFGRDSLSLQTFVDEVYLSLPSTHRGHNVVLVGFSRGGTTMSAYARRYMSCATIFVACPLDVADCRKKSKRVYSFGHVNDVVYMLSTRRPLRVHVRKVFNDKKGKTLKEVASTVHTGFVAWLDDVASDKRIAELCHRGTKPPMTPKS